MSYDWLLHSDKRRSKTHPKESIRTYLLGLSEMRPNGSGAAYGDPNGSICAFFYLEYVTPEGDDLPSLREMKFPGLPPPREEEKTHVNQIHVSIPAAHVEETRDAIYNPILLLSEFLGWRVFDPQEGMYWDEM